MSFGEEEEPVGSAGLGGCWGEGWAEDVESLLRAAQRPEEGPGLRGPEGFGRVGTPGVLFVVGSCSLACHCTGRRLVLVVGNWAGGPGSGEGPGTAERRPGPSPAHSSPQASRGPGRGPTLKACIVLTPCLQPGGDIWGRGRTVSGKGGQAQEMAIITPD